MEGSDAGFYGNHPYAPRCLKLPGFVLGFLSQSTIVGVYGVSFLLVVSLTWLFSGRSPRISKLDRWPMCWWAFTGLAHLILEGYFEFAPEFYKDKDCLGKSIAKVIQDMQLGMQASLLSKD